MKIILALALMLGLQSSAFALPSTECTKCTGSSGMDAGNAGGWAVCPAGATNGWWGNDSGVTYCCDWNSAPGSPGCDQCSSVEPGPCGLPRCVCGGGSSSSSSSTSSGGSGSCAPHVQTYQPKLEAIGCN